MKARLTNTFSATDCTALEDMFSCLLANIEDSFIQSGFIAGNHYNHKTIIDAALPLLLSSWRTGKITFTAAWPLPQKLSEGIPLSLSQRVYKGFDWRNIFSVRTSNCLRNMGFESIEKLCSATECELLENQNFGRKSLHEVKDYLLKTGLSLKA